MLPFILLPPFLDLVTVIKNVIYMELREETGNKKLSHA